jgi:glycosyltransferase involved in cell wall biosynthesis
MTPTVSVVIPTYNQASLLPEAIASVCAQQWPNLEIIVVDDGSTDDTQKVLNQLSSERSLRWFRQNNAGAAAARNRGIHAATGEWIAFLDADDFWLPAKLAIQFEQLEKHGADFSFTNSRLRFENGHESELRCPIVERPLFHQLLTGNLFGTPTVVLRKSCFDRVGLFDEQLRTGEDWDMWLRLASTFTHVWVKEPLAVVRNISQSKFPVTTLASCTLQVLERLFSREHVTKYWPEVVAKRRLVYAWHYSVLAKSYASDSQVLNSCLFSLRAIAAHPAALQFLVTGRKKILC